LAIVQAIGDIKGEGYALGNLGNLLMQVRRYSDALKCLQASLEIFSKIHDSYAQTQALVNLAKLYCNLNQRILAFEYCDRALSLATELDIPLQKECRELKEQLECHNS
jgi:tetratricopeptide (TPR) repeat protein